MGGGEERSSARGAIRTGAREAGVQIRVAKAVALPENALALPPLTNQPRIETPDPGPSTTPLYRDNP
jgi:hypothetical protein